jgi:hypothetical protein
MNRVFDILSGEMPVYDSTIYKVLSRNPEWKNMVVVADLTGSMYPFAALMLRWILVNREAGKIKHIVFFNDGDDNLHFRRDGRPRPKNLGSTGGIYQLKPDSLHNILTTMDYVMWAGDGEDLAENNLEALLAAMEKFPDEKEYYMIADNIAPVRDMALIEKIKKPVHVIVCQTPNRYDSVHPHYVKIAWKTRGSIHLLEGAVSFSKATPMDKFINVRKTTYFIDPYENVTRN